MTIPRGAETAGHARDGDSQNAEHHRALCALLQGLQPCRNAQDILKVLLDNMVALSWLGLASRAAGFLVAGRKLELAAQCNLLPAQQSRCSQLNLGECLCGTVAETGQRILCSSASRHHTLHDEDMPEHEHVVLPLGGESKVLGVLNLYLAPGEKLTPSRLEFLEAAANGASVALAEQVAREEAKRARELLLTSVITSQENERKRVAQKLHEGLGPSLSALLVELRLFCEENSISARSREACERKVRELVEQTRQMALELRPSILDDFGLHAALTRHIEGLSKRAEVKLDYQYLQSPGREGRLPGPIEVVLYRIAQEALSNVIRHADAANASIVLSWTERAILLLVEDDGVGFDYTTTRQQPDHCLGLIGMEERAILCKGQFLLDSAVGKGTTLRVVIPVADAD